MQPDLKQYFKVKMVSHKQDGNIKVVDTKGNVFKIPRPTAPFLRVGDVFQGKPALDMASNAQTLVVIKLLTELDSDVMIATFPPKSPEAIRTP